MPSAPTELTPLVLAGGAASLGAAALTAVRLRRRVRAMPRSQHNAAGIGALYGGAGLIAAALAGAGVMVAGGALLEGALLGHAYFFFLVLVATVLPLGIPIGMMLGALFALASRRPT